MERNKKRNSPDFPQKVEEDEENDQISQTNPKTKRTCNSFSTGSEAESAIETMFFSPESWSQMEAFLRQLVSEEVDSKFESYLHFFLPSSSNNQLNYHQNGEGMAAGSETLKLCFLNQIPSTIFTNNVIEAENGDPLQVALIDVNNFNAIVSMGPLSMAQIEIIVLDGDPSEFDDKSILSQRVGKRPLIVGDDLKLYLKNGLGLIKSLSFTDNSSWLRSKKFRLGIRITEDTILAEFPRIEEAVSQPFRVLDHRGEANKKHHPPKREDKVWRLEGIGKNGVYHNILSSKGIETVDDFLKIYIGKGPTYLKKLLGNKVPKKIWKAMVNNALECVPVVNFAPSFEMQNFVGSEAMGRDKAFEGNIEGSKQRNSNYHNNFLETTFVGLDKEWEQPMLNFEDPSLLLYGEASISSTDNQEVRNTSTCNRYYQGP